MTRAFIWDLDGTLLDSYEAILDGIAETYAHYSLGFDREAVHSFILQQSVQALLEEVAREHGLDAEEMNRYRASSLREKNAQVHLMLGARDILAWAKEEGIVQFVYTHKGKNAYPILEDLGVLSYFQEVVTTDNGFRRKPDPEGVDYLVDKYQLDRSETYYIGDRTLDVDLADNAGIVSINFLDYKPDVNHAIRHLDDIRLYFEEEKS